MVVGIVKSDERNLDKNLRRLFESIKYKPGKKKIFIKPNLVYAASYKKGITTPITLVESLIKYFKEFSNEIVIGEGSGIGHETEDVFKKLGYERLAKKYNVKLIDLNKVERKKVKWKYGELSLPKLLKDYEYINVANFKTHTMTTVSLGMKNQKGLLFPEDKKNFHWLGLNKPIKELNKIVKPDLTIISGLYCLEGNSISIINKSKRLNLLVAGKNVIEVDNVCIEIMGFDNVDHIPKLKYDIAGVPVERVKSRFLPAQTTRKIFNTEFMLKGCSGCSVATERAIRSLKKNPIKAFSFFCKSLFGGIFVISGKKILLPKNKKKVICVGICTKDMVEKYKFNYIKGCPPNPNDILRGLLK